MSPWSRLALLQASVVTLNVLGAWTSVALVALGATPSAASAALSLLPALSLIAGPAWGRAADQSPRPGRLLARASLGVALATTAALVVPTADALVGVLVVYTVFRAGQTPLLDAQTLALLGADRDGYGRLRAIGSVGFTVAMAVGGVVADGWPRGPFLLPCVAAWMAALLAPGLSRDVSPATGGAWRALASHPRLWLLGLAAGLHGLGLTAYDRLFPLLVAERGLPAWVTGAAMGGGVVVEVAVLASGRWWLTRLGAERLLLVSLAVSAPRWWLTGTVADPLVLVALQGLHGLTFGGFWLAGVRLAAELAPPGASSTAQAMLGAITFGLASTASLAGAAWWLTDGTVADLQATLAAPALASAVVAALALRR